MHCKLWQIPSWLTIQLLPHLPLYSWNICWPDWRKWDVSSSKYIRSKISSVVFILTGYFDIDNSMCDCLRIIFVSANAERSNLYLKLFKLVFGSVSLLAAENEKMLKPHLHTIVNRSMELALSAKEPYNYFLLLRALFRSIGGGSHDLLYQEFLPLLPNLLQGIFCFLTTIENHIYM